MSKILRWVQGHTNHGENFCQDFLIHCLYPSCGLQCIVTETITTVTLVPRPRPPIRDTHPVAWRICCSPKTHNVIQPKRSPDIDNMSLTCCWFLTGPITFLTRLQRQTQSGIESHLVYISVLQSIGEKRTRFFQYEKADYKPGANDSMLKYSLNFTSQNPVNSPVKLLWRWRCRMTHRGVTILRGCARRQPRQVHSYAHVGVSSQSLSLLIHRPLQCAQVC